MDEFIDYSSYSPKKVVVEVKKETPAPKKVEESKENPASHRFS